MLYCCYIFKNVSFIISSFKFGKVKDVLMKHTPWLLKMVPCHIICLFLILKEIKYFFTPHAEEMMAEGKNWEHSKEAVHAGKLKMLINIYSTWKQVMVILLEKYPKVCLFIVTC